MSDYKTTRIWTKTLRKLRLIAALTDESIVGLIDRLSDTELRRVQRKGAFDSGNDSPSSEVLPSDRTPKP